MLITLLAEQLGVSRTAVIELAIRRLAKEQGIRYTQGK
jgi:DNA-binding FadR family transcriptional regulator